jgi:hypothetical protein
MNSNEKSMISLEQILGERNKTNKINNNKILNITNNINIINNMEIVIQMMRSGL